MFTTVSYVLSPCRKKIHLTDCLGNHIFRYHRSQSVNHKYHLLVVLFPRPLPFSPPHVFFHTFLLFILAAFHVLFDDNVLIFLVSRDCSILHKFAYMIRYSVIFSKLTKHRYRYTSIYLSLYIYTYLYADLNMMLK